MSNAESSDLDALEDAEESVADLYEGGGSENELTVAAEDVTAAAAEDITAVAIVAEVVDGAGGGRA